jgi:hypothetical protein
VDLDAAVRKRKLTQSNVGFRNNRRMSKRAYSVSGVHACTCDTVTSHPARKGELEVKKWSTALCSLRSCVQFSRHRLYSARIGNIEVLTADIGRTSSVQVTSEQARGRCSSEVFLFLFFCRRWQAQLSPYFSVKGYAPASPPWCPFLFFVTRKCRSASDSDSPSPDTSSDNINSHCISESCSFHFPQAIPQSWSPSSSSSFIAGLVQNSSRMENWTKM